MKKPFEELCSLIDEFWKQYEEPSKPGPRPEYRDDFYLKLYWYGILSRCPEKSRFLERGAKDYPKIFNKRHKPAYKTMMHRLIQIEPVAREFWRWLQLKLQVEHLVELEDVLLDATTIEVVLFARVGESTLERLKDCNFGKKTTEDRWFFGKKLHLISAPNGTMIRFRLTSGNPHDSRKFSSLNSKKFKRVTGDSAYRAVGVRQGQKKAISKPFSKEKRQRQLHAKRVGVERVFNALKHLNLEKGVVIKQARSLGAHILAVLTCLLAVQYVNLVEWLRPLEIQRFLC